MRTVMKSSEVAHVWANRGQTEAKTASRNFYIGRADTDGDTVYSYGSHFPVGRHVQSADGQRSAVLITTRTYSPTTAGHIRDVESATRHLETFHVPMGAARWNSSDDTPSGYFASYVDRVRETLEKASRARANRPWLIQSAQSLAAEGDRYAQFAGLPTRIALPVDLNEALAAARAAKAERDRLDAAAVADRRARQAAEQERARAAALAAVDDWRAGRRSSIPYVSTLPADLLRLTADGQTVETSRGATVPMPHFRRAFRTLKRLHDAGQTYAQNGHSMMVGHYRVSRMDAGMVQVGCHSFQWDEVQTFATRAGLDAGPSTVADIPDNLEPFNDDETVATIKARIGPAAAPFSTFFVSTADGEYSEVWGIIGPPELTARAWRIIPPPTWIDTMTPAAATTEGGAL